MRTNPFLKTYLWLSLGLLLAGAALAYFWWQSLSPPPSPFEQQHIMKERTRIVDSLIEAYHTSQIRSLNAGDTFPNLDYPILLGEAPDWQKPTLLTIGSDVHTSTPVETHTTLADEALQHIHIVTNSKRLAELEQWPDYITILDGIGEADYYSGYDAGEKLKHDLGLASSSANYFIDGQTIILRKLYAIVPQNFTDAIKGYMQQGQLAADAPLLPNLAIGSELTLDIVPDTVRQSMQQEFAKPISLVFFDEKPFCAVCRRDFLVHGSDFIKKWRQAGYGLVVVEGGYDNFSAERLDNGILKITDKGNIHNYEGHELMETWGDIPAIKHTLLLKQGKVQGLMGWRESIINGKVMKDLHFAALDEVIQQLVTEGQ